MTERTSGWPQSLAWLALAATVLLAALGARLNPAVISLPDLLWLGRFFSFPIVGALIASSRPRQPVGWLLLSIGMAIAADLAIDAWAPHLFASDPNLGAVVYLVGDQLAKVTFALIGVLLLLFPTGRLPSRRWGWVLGALLTLLWLGLLSGMLQPGPVRDPTCSAPSCSLPNAPSNPLGVSFAPLQVIGGGVGFLIFCALLVLAAASLVVRYRRSDVDDRQRLKWFTYAATTLGTIELGDAVMSVLPPDQVSGLQLPYGVAEFVVTIGAAVAIAIAVLRHRLFDIDRIISRTTAYGALGALILAFYLGVVVGVGALVGAGSPSRLLLSILATAVVAVAFQPARVRLQRLADRLLYGRRLTPYELLARFSAQLGQGMGFGDVLSEMARVLAEGTGSRGAAVWLREGDTEVLAAGWPDGAAVTPAGATRMAPIQNHGEEFGRLVVQRPGERLSPMEERLMDELALQAGLVVHNLRLATEVRLRIEELRHSRARLVTAQDAERRRLERDLHDGAQQNLVSLRMKLGLAQALATGVPKLEELLEQLQAEAGEALASVRALSRGVYPPLLESRGLASALSARARQVGIPVTVECTGDRYAPEVEGATYFCCAEALQNLTKHARAQHASMRVWADSGALWFAVEDDGAGFLPPAAEGHQGLQNIRDRLEALGGALEVRSAPGRGTSVAGRLPLLEAPDVAEDPEAGHAAAAASGHQPGTASGIDVRPASAS